MNSWSFAILATPAIKRVVGAPGDTVALDAGTVVVNGQTLTEPYLPRQSLTHPVPSVGTHFALQGNEFFVLGDNRSHSMDSRFYGPIQRSQIIGRVQP